MKPIVFSLCMFLLSQPVRAEIFANQFIQFEKPPGWSCTLEGAEWVCQSKNPRKKKDAIIILAAKLKGDQDSLDQYKEFLAQPKTYKSVTGKPVRSDAKFSKVSKINGHPWVDALHLESEIPGFYTRYLATVKQSKIAVLVTFSISERQYDDMASQFESMVKTLKVFYKEGGINKNTPPSEPIFPRANTIEKTIFPKIANSDGEEQSGNPSQASPEQSDDLLFLIVVLGGLVAFIIYRRRQNG